MTISISLPPDVEAKLRERAAAAGKDIGTYALEAVKEKVEAPQTFAEILAPVHEAFRAQGLTEDQMTPVFERLRDEVHQNSGAKSGKAS